MYEFRFFYSASSSAHCSQKKPDIHKANSATEWVNPQAKLNLSLQHCLTAARSSQEYGLCPCSPLVSLPSVLPALS